MNTKSYKNPAAGLLKDELEHREISQKFAAEAMSIPASRLTDIIHGRKRVSIDTAMSLERFFGIRASLWLSIQQDHELKMAEKEKGEMIGKEVQAV